jgi:hypothetical protein
MSEKSMSLNATPLENSKKVISTEEKVDIKNFLDKHGHTAAICHTLHLQPTAT